MKLANASWLQLLEDHPLATLIGCSIGILLAICLGGWWVGRAKRRGESVGVWAIILVAIVCVPTAYIAGFVSSHQLERLRDFARADAQYSVLDSERAALYDKAMDFIARVDDVDSQVKRLARTSTTEADIQQLLETNSSLASEVGDLQQEAERQHERAKQIRAQYRELSIVVHTGKMIDELDKQVMRLQKATEQLQETVKITD